MPHRRLCVVPLVLLVLAGAAAGCRSSGSATVARSSGAASSPASAPATTRAPSPRPSQGLTGLPGGIGRPVLAVKIDNTRPAHPQVGVGAADIVYVEPVEGELTRLMAVFSSQVPAVIGPVRSARQSDLDLLGEYGRVDLAFSGANSGVLRLVRRAPVNEVSPETVPAAFFRSATRRSPYNLFLRSAPALATRRAAPAGDIGLTFAAPVPAGTPTSGFTVRYGPSARVSVRYDPTSRSWPVSMDGRAARTTEGGRLAPANVVVQFVPVRPSRFRDVLGNPTPFVSTTGAGVAVLCRDGRAVRARWSRRRVPDGTRLIDRAGRDVALRPGRTWILLVPTGTPVAF